MTSSSTMSFKGLTAILILSLLYGSAVLAVPVHPDDVTPGAVFAGRPKHFNPKGSKTAGKHPVVALTHADSSGNVKVAPISHNHPAGSVTKPTTDYGLPSHEKDGHEHHVDLSPKTVHHDHLSHVSATHPLSGESVAGEHLENLQIDTGTA